MSNLNRIKLHFREYRWMESNQGIRKQSARSETRLKEKKFKSISEINTEIEYSFLNGNALLRIGVFFLAFSLPEIHRI